MKKYITPDRYAVDEETGCWEWQQGKAGRGYGVVSVEGRKKAYAHRVAYEENVGPIPPGLVIDHLCRNIACVNPAHLEPVTTAENVRRGLCAIGDEEIVEHIRICAADGYNYSQVAEMFGVGRDAVEYIVKGKRWAGARGPISSVDRRRKVTDEQVAEIRRRYRTDSDVTVAQMAAEYGIRPGTLMEIAHGIRRCKVDAEAFEGGRRRRFSAADVVEMRRLHRSGASQKAIADKYSADPSTISRIVRGLTRVTA